MKEQNAGGQEQKHIKSKFEACTIKHVLTHLYFLLKHWHFEVQVFLQVLRMDLQKSRTNYGFLKVLYACNLIRCPLFIESIIHQLVNFSITSIYDVIIQGNIDISIRTRYWNRMMINNTNSNFCWVSIVLHGILIGILKGLWFTRVFGMNMCMYSVRI